MGTRPLTAALVTALTAQKIYPLLLVEGEFDSGVVRMWNGIGDLSALGQTWTGVGELLSLTQVEETLEVRAVGIQIGLSGIPASFVSLALAEDYQGRPARVYIGAFNATTGALVADPVLTFEGRIDTMPISEDGETAQIVAAVESRLIRLETATRRRYTAQDQRFDWPDDSGLDHVAALQDVDIVWGAKSAIPDGSNANKTSSASLPSDGPGSDR